MVLIQADQVTVELTGNRAQALPVARLVVGQQPALMLTDQQWLSLMRILKMFSAIVE